jgi:hypothetical protein
MIWANPDYIKKLKKTSIIKGKIKKKHLNYEHEYRKRNTYICIILILNLIIFISKATENYTNTISVVEFCCSEEDFNKIS